MSHRSSFVTTYVISSTVYCTQETMFHPFTQCPIIMIHTIHSKPHLQSCSDNSMAAATSDAPQGSFITAYSQNSIFSCFSAAGFMFFMALAHVSSFSYDWLLHNVCHWFHVVCFYCLCCNCVVDWNCSAESKTSFPTGTKKLYLEADVRFSRTNDIEINVYITVVASISCFRVTVSVYCIIKMNLKM